jgi:hypothetical protein
MNAATGFTRVAQTNADGNYVALDLPIGIYDVSTSVPGFKKEVVEQIHVDVGSKPSVDYGLNYGTLFDYSPDILAITTTGFTALASAALNFNNYQRIYAAKDDSRASSGITR